MLSALKKMDSSKFEKAISPNNYDIKDSNQKTTTIVVRSASNERNNVKNNITKKLKTLGIKFIHKIGGGSIGTTEVFFDYHTVKITYKPISGGMSETTLNSTITELAPVIAFMNGRKKFKSVEEFYKFLTTSNSGGVYLNDSDEKAGSKFIEMMPSSSKFKEKMQNSIAILDFLHDKNSESPIKQIYWGYRNKPKGVLPTHKGDIFLRFSNGKYLGVSLKAGSENSPEPQLNTFVNKFFDDFGDESGKKSIIDNVYNNIHSKLGLEKDWQTTKNKPNSLKTITTYKKKYPNEFSNLYDSMLDIIRTFLIKTINSNMNATISYIEKQILKKDNDVPLLVVKAYGTNYKFVTDEDSIGTFLPKITSIVAYPSTTSKQNWHIDLIAGKKSKITMNMSVRSNKTEPENKVAQGFNLSIKFNGVSKN